LFSGKGLGTNKERGLDSSGGGCSTSGGGGSAGGVLYAGQATIGAASLCYETAAYKTLQLLIGAEAEHFLTTTDGVFQFEIVINETEQSIELMSLSSRENIHQFISNMIRDTTRETSLTSGSHRDLLYSTPVDECEVFIDHFQIKFSFEKVLKEVPWNARV
jgi:hypothetical protein